MFISSALQTAFWLCTAEFITSVSCLNDGHAHILTLYIHVLQGKPVSYIHQPHQWMEVMPRNTIPPGSRHPVNITSSSGFEPVRMQKLH